ncbi:MAG: hypothetical protein ACREO4_09230 [Lysobacter sp.]
MNRNRSEASANAGLAAGRRVNAKPAPVTSRNVLPASRVLKWAAGIVAAVIVATEAAPYVLAVLS